MKNKMTIRSNNSTSEQKPQRIKSRVLKRCLCIIFIEAVFAIAKGWKQSKHTSEDEWINEIWYIHTMKYYSALKRKEILTHAARW